MKRKQRARRGNREEIELEAWLERSRANPAEEPAFYRRLLCATVFVHTPASDDSGKVRLVQFRHPDGFDAIPFFTSLAKAQLAGSASVRVLALTGRELLAGTLGATLMLNPNDGGAVLYPEEIALLLTTGFMARIEKTEHARLHVRAPQAVPGWLTAAVHRSVQQAEFVDAAYILESHPAQACETPPGLLIYLVADLRFTERAARLVTAAVQPLCSDQDPVIDVMIHDGAKPLPECLAQPGVVPVFTRRPAATSP